MVKKINWLWSTTFGFLVGGAGLSYFLIVCVLTFGLEGMSVRHYNALKIFFVIFSILLVCSIIYFILDVKKKNKLKEEIPIARYAFLTLLAGIVLSVIFFIAGGYIYEMVLSLKRSIF